MPETEMPADPSLVPAPSAPSEQELDALFARHEAASLINLDTAIRLNALRFNGRDYDEEREFAREYFSADDDFREFMRCLPAEYEGLLSAAVSSSGSVEHG